MSMGATLMVAIAGCHGRWNLESVDELVRRSENEKKWKEPVALIILLTPPPRNHRRTITMIIAIIVYFRTFLTIALLYLALLESPQLLAHYFHIAPRDLFSVFDADAWIGALA